MYTLLTESRGVSPEIAGIMTGSYWAMFTFGRILAGWFSSKIATRKLIYLCIVVAMLGAGLLCADTGQLTAILGILLAGFAIAPIFPGLVSDTEKPCRYSTSGQHNRYADFCGRSGCGCGSVDSRNTC